MSAVSQLSASRGLAALVGVWRGEEAVAATQWAAAGQAVADVSAELGSGDKFLFQSYSQKRDGKETFCSRNVFGVDPADGLVRMFQFDSMGFMPVAASGDWADDVLTLERSSPRGEARLTYRFTSADAYELAIEFKPVGADWQPMMSGVYRRVSNQLNA